MMWARRPYRLSLVVIGALLFPRSTTSSMLYPAWESTSTQFARSEASAHRSNFGQLPKYFANDQGQLNEPAIDQSAVALAAGGGHNCALTSVSGVKCWGWNAFGQLGDGTTNQQTVPVDVTGLASGVIALTAGGRHTCVLVGGGVPVCWGDNGLGQIGVDTTNQSTTPVYVSGHIADATAIAAGGSHTCVLTAEGGVKCWGNNSAGQLGDGTTDSRSTPEYVSGLTSGVSAIVAGWEHTCVRTNVGEVKCWGKNSAGQLGDGTTGQHAAPVLINGLHVSAIAAGYYHTCAQTVGGTLMCWGNNSSGQLGDGTTNQRNLPEPVSGDTSDVKELAAAQDHTCALTVDHGVKCWGANSSGQLGDESTSPHSVPKDVNNLTNGVAAIAADHLHTCALMMGGGVKCWGNNYSGQLGNGTTDMSTTPVDVVGISSVNQPNPFLDLPFHYDGTRAAFNQFVQNHWSLTDGKITSWFDHNYPTGSSPDGRLVIFTGEVLPTADDKRCGFGAYCYDDHNGIDIIGVSGSDVLAAGDGIVVRSISGCENNAGGCVGFGNFVVIQHLLPNTNGYYTLYGHLSAVDVVTGTSVIRGQTVIGKLGSTGNSSGPHIHFGVYRDDGDGVYQTSATDKPVDPFGYVGTNPLSDPWVTTPQTVSYRLWIHDPTTNATTGGQATTLVGATQNVTATIPANRFPGQATLELTTGPVAGPSAQLRQAGQSFWLTLIEWIQGLDATPGALPADSVAAADPITVTIQYSAAQAQHLDMNQAAIYRWDDATAGWQALPTTLNAQTRTLTGLSPDVGQFSPQAPLLCPANTSEPDDDLYRATSLSFGSASAGHVFDSAADEDWFAWEAQAHVPYVIRTQGLAAGVDTVLEIRDASGQNVLATDDNSGGGAASHLERTFAEAGTYFARVIPKAGSATGCASAYQVSVFIPRVFLPGLSR